MSHAAGVIIESLVAILLAVTIAYCIMLDKRLRRLKADEASLRAIIGELVAATESAERAIGGLKATVRDCDDNLSQRLRAAERFSGDFARQIAAGEDIVRRINQTLGGTRHAAPSAASASPAPARAASGSGAASAPDAGGLLAAAQAFARRTGARGSGAAA